MCFFFFFFFFARSVNPTIVWWFATENKHTRKTKEQKEVCELSSRSSGLNAHRESRNGIGDALNKRRAVTFMWSCECEDLFTITNGKGKVTQGNQPSFLLAK